MRSIILLLSILAAGACAAPATIAEPSLAPRAAEAIDPRAPIPADIPAGTADAALAERLEALVVQARGGVAAFDALEAEAARLAAAAGPVSSEGWVVAQQALSRLVEQFGITTRVAADIDALAATRLEANRWISPADQASIRAAASDVAAISDTQTAALARIREQLAR